MDRINIFVEPKHLKNWAIQVANSCGGQEVSKSQYLNQSICVS